MKSFFCILLLWLTSTPIIAQYFQDDAAAWLEISLEKEIRSKLFAELELQGRFNNNFTRLGSGTAGAGVLYKINKMFRVGGGYRFRTNPQPDGSLSLRHQVFASVIARHKVNQFTFAYRCRFQAQVKDFHSSADGKVPVWYNRHKLTVKYDLNKKFYVFAAEEIYLLIKPDFYGTDRSRSFAGTGLHLNRRSSLEGYFLFQREYYSDKQLRRDFIYGITYSYNF